MTAQIYQNPTNHINTHRTAPLPRRAKTKNAQYNTANSKCIETSGSGCVNQCSGIVDNSSGGTFQPRNRCFELIPTLCTIKNILFLVCHFCIWIKSNSTAPRLRSKSTKIFGRVPDILNVRCRFHFYYFYHSFVVYILNKDSFQLPKNWIGFRPKNILLVAVLTFKINDGRSNSFSRPFNKTISESNWLPDTMAIAVFRIVFFLNVNCIYMQSYRMKFDQNWIIYYF